MMNLITFAITIAPQKQAEFVTAVDDLRSRWIKENITVSLFRDAGRGDRFLLLLLTDKKIDDVTGMIKDAGRAGNVFANMKSAEGSISVSCLEQVL